MVCFNALGANTYPKTNKDLALFSWQFKPSSDRVLLLTVDSKKVTFSTDTRRKIKISAIIEDSRCPKEAQCKWAGNAKIEFILYGSSKDKQRFELNSNARFSKSIVIDGLKIQLHTVNPIRESNRKLKKNQYRVQLIIEAFDK